MHHLVVAQDVVGRADERHKDDVVEPHTVDMHESAAHVHHQPEPEAPEHPRRIAQPAVAPLHQGDQDRERDGIEQELAVAQNQKSQRETGMGEPG